jgi:hypothetical protein
MDLFKKTQDENAETAMFFGDVFLNAHVGKKATANNLQYFFRFMTQLNLKSLLGPSLLA